MKLSQIEETRKEKTRTKFKKKMSHLKKKFKYKQEENDKKHEDVPIDIQEFSNCIVFDKKKFDDLTVETYEVKRIGNVDLMPDEETLLKLHPKFCILDNLSEQEFQQEQEAALA